MKDKKYYINSKGEKIDISTLETTHLINTIAKKRREIFNCKNKTDAVNAYKEIEDLKEEYHLRYNKYFDTLED